MAIDTTLSLTPEQASQLRQLIDAGVYESPEAFVDASLSAAYTETEAFAEAAREKLAASQRAVDEGRVASVPYGQLARFIAERNKQARS